MRTELEGNRTGCGKELAERVWGREKQEQYDGQRPLGAGAGRDLCEHKTWFVYWFKLDNKIASERPWAWQ